LDHHGDDVGQFDVSPADVNAISVQRHEGGGFDRLVQTCVIILVTGEKIVLK
jgi:hypothetical protein